MYGLGGSVLDRGQSQGALEVGVGFTEACDAREHLLTAYGFASTPPAPVVLHYPPVSRISSELSARESHRSPNTLMTTHLDVVLRQQLLPERLVALRPDLLVVLHRDRLGVCAAHQPGAESARRRPSTALEHQGWVRSKQHLRRVNA